MLTNRKYVIRIVYMKKRYQQLMNYINDNFNFNIVDNKEWNNGQHIDINLYCTSIHFMTILKIMEERFLIDIIHFYNERSV